VLSDFSAIVSNVVHFRLEAKSNYSGRHGDNLEWLHTLQQFSTVQALYISREFGVQVASALESISGEEAETLPSLDLICLKGQPTSCIEKFIAVRRLSGRPVTAVSTEEEFDRILNSYNKN